MNTYTVVSRDFRNTSSNQIVYREVIKYLSGFMSLHSPKGAFPNGRQSDIFPAPQLFLLLATLERHKTADKKINVTTSSRQPTSSFSFPKLILKKEIITCIGVKQFCFLKIPPIPQKAFCNQSKYMLRILFINPHIHAVKFDYSKYLQV